MLQFSDFKLSFLPEGYITSCNDISKCLQRNDYEVRQNLLFGCLALVVVVVVVVVAFAAVLVT